MNDTSPEMEKKMHELLLAKTPYERLLMASSMHASSRYLIIRGILQENPNISKTELMKELFLKFYHDDFSPEEKEKILKSLEDYHNRH